MNRKLSIVLAFPAFVFFLPALTAETKLDPRVFAGRAAGESASFLVVLKGQADLSGAEAFPDKAEKGRFVFEALRAQAETSQAPLLAALDAAGVSYRSFYLVNMIEVTGDRPLALALASRDDVSTIAPNPEIALSRGPDDPEEATASAVAGLTSPATVEPNIAKVGAPSVWSQGFTGQGIVVGMADTGTVWDHPVLKAHYRGFNGTAVSHDYNWHDAVHNAAAANPCGSDAPAPCDDDSHGTATASLVVGDDGAGNQIGMAPGAKFISCRNMDQGFGTPARYTECFQFFMAPTDHTGANPRPDLAAHVINNSWGCPLPPASNFECTDPDILRGVVENVRAAGIVVVVSAGNSGPACSTIVDPPAFYAASFSIGATTLSDTIASFSSRGPIIADGSNRMKPDISAPGQSVRVARPPNTYNPSFSGTSGSAPHVTGAVALLWSAAPQLIGQVVATTNVLERTAVPMTSTQDCGGFSGASVPNPVFGWGRLDVAAAVNVSAPPARPKAVLSRRHGTPRRVLPRT